MVFTDLVGSTALANQLDPEDLDKLLRRYRDACTAVIAKFDGYVAQYLGDGVLAYFGYPKAQEHAAERAIRSALEIVNEVERLQRPDGLPLRARVGVATGLVVGETGGAGAEREQTVVGDTPNLAARLQALAAPGSVLVGPTTRQLTGEFFEYASAGEHAIKGFDHPVPVWRVVRERKIESRFAAARGAFAGPIVARERELAFLSDSWQRAARATATSCCSPAKPGWASRGCSKRLPSGFAASRIGCCAVNARPITATARCIRSPSCCGMKPRFSRTALPTKICVASKPCCRALAGRRAGICC